MILTGSQVQDKAADPVDSSVYRYIASQCLDSSNSPAMEVALKVCTASRASLNSTSVCMVIVSFILELSRSTKGYIKDFHSDLGSKVH